MMIIKFSLEHTINYKIKMTFLLVFSMLLSNIINSQNMENTIEHNSFLIVEKPQKTYIGIYKNGIPFNGYFPKGDQDFPRVDYYENGEAKFQYSLDVFQMAMGAEMVETDEELFKGEQDETSEEYQMSEEEYKEYERNLYKAKLNIKSVYKDGQIVQGYEYIEAPSALFSKKIMDGKVVALYFDIFAMHYYQRTSMILKSDSIVIESPTLAVEGDKFQTNLLKKDEYWEIKYVMNNENVGSKYFVIGETNNLPKNSILFMYDKNDSTYSYGTRGFQDYLPTLDLINISNIFFDKPEIFKSTDMNTFFSDLIEATIVETKREEGTYPKEPEKYRGYLETGDNGNIVTGIRFFNKGVDSYYEEYIEGNSAKKEKIDIVNFQKEFKNYLNKVRNK
ncbi:hypothetical protein [Aquimarina sp. Aq107]|uniref:hypothetical protein n=2 Tax=Aquimarina sp. Aq107 TaxID=1191912 RepID=UPI0020B18582|nr:hypothetical protein [Aquimarina sp. Aq107]